MDSREVSTTAPVPAPGLARERLLDPVNLIIFPAVAVLAVARHYGVTADIPLTRIVAALVLVHATALAFAARFPPGSSRAKPLPFLLIAIGLGGVFNYTVGWGPLFAVSFVASAAVVIHTDGARWGVPAIVIACIATVLGEIAVETGAAPSIVPPVVSHGLAIFLLSVTALVIGIITRGEREKECAKDREREAEERFRALIQYASDAVVVFGTDAKVKYASPATEQLYGIPPEELHEFDLGFVDPDHIDITVAAFERLHGRQGAVESLDVPIRRRDGTSRWVEVRITNLTENPAVGGYVANMRDIGERRIAQQQLMHDASHDELTQVLNRRHFLERLQDACDRAPHDTLLAVLFVDVDHFKNVNDRLGHEAGDAVLVSVADRLTALLRADDVVARFGGDEFTVLLEDLVDSDAAYEIADRIINELCGRRRIGRHEMLASVSVGVALANGRTLGAQELLRRADQAMYFAKQSGRGRWELFDDYRTSEQSAS